MGNEPFIKKHLNPDGKSYNGAAVLADLAKLLHPTTDITQEEVSWVWKRMIQLIRVEKKSKDEAKAIVREETKVKPWLKSR